MKVSPVKEVRVPVEVVLGGTTLSLEDFSSLGPGSILELNRIAGEPVDLVAAGNKIALGEVVIIDESFGIRITKVHDERS
jgi:flagellar motor switch protein FliN/FliY